MQVKHPLEPLYPDEIRRSRQIIFDNIHRFNYKKEGKRFISFMLEEPSKQFVLNFKEGTPFDRIISVVCLDENLKLPLQIQVSLSKNDILFIKELPHVQPMIVQEEFIKCEETCKKDPRVIQALKDRGNEKITILPFIGIHDPNLLMIDPWTAGYYGDEGERGKRLLRSFIWVRMHPDDNGYAHPVEGLIVTVDLYEWKVIDIYNDMSIPIPKDERHYEQKYFEKQGGKMREKFKPIIIQQPKGVEFTVDRNEVKWCKWSFRVGFNEREGLTLHNIHFHNRPICYRASVAEMLVPYGNPNFIHSRKNVFDIGDYGIGKLANSLVLGCDCKGEIYYFDGVISVMSGEPVIIKNAICLHEEDASILWKHKDWRRNVTDTRRARRLVVSSFATVGNYEYGFYWYFSLEGSIDFEVKHTGIINTNAVSPQIESTKYGTIVGRGLEGQVHQHIYCVRLDMMVDGIQNSIEEIDLVPEDNDKINLRGNAFYPKRKLLKTEKEARKKINTKRGRFNPSKKELFQPTAYRLIPYTNCFPFSKENSWIRKRASFINYHLWVTPFHKDEKYPAGEYPNQSDGKSGGPGLMDITDKNRNIVNQDLVIWFVCGINHIVRPEDFPVMPVYAAHFFTLSPNGFFRENPTLDIPPETKEENQSCHMRSKL